MFKQTWVTIYSWERARKRQKSEADEINEKVNPGPSPLGLPRFKFTLPFCRAYRACLCLLTSKASALADMILGSPGIPWLTPLQSTCSSTSPPFFFFSSRLSSPQFRFLVLLLCTCDCRYKSAMSLSTRAPILELCSSMAPQRCSCPLCFTLAPSPCL